MTHVEFVNIYKEMTGRSPTAGDWYYHLECMAYGAKCSVHQADPVGTEAPRYLRVPADGEATLHAEDIRGQDR